MKACRFACVLALGAAIVEACGGDLPKAGVSAVPPGLPPDASAPPRVIEGDAATDPMRVDARFVQGQTRISAPACSRVFIAIARGKATSAKDVLEAGDVMIVKYPDETFVNVDGLALQVIQPFPCQIFDKPGPEVAFRRANQAPELTWANGEMHAHLDLGSDRKQDGEISPDLYLGRLSGTAGVAEHRHPTSIEILAAIEASGTFTLAGVPKHLGPREIVTVPKDTPHSWRPDPGSKLVAIQMYLPPGPEQRFVTLDADDKAAKDAGKR